MQSSSDLKLKLWLRFPESKTPNQVDIEVVRGKTTQTQRNFFNKNLMQW